MQNFIMRPGPTLLSRIILLVFAFIVAGCSALRIGYSNGDRFAYWWLDNYVGFTDEQKPWVKDDIARLLAWHRQTQLPDYTQLLAQTQQRLQQPISARDVHADFDVLKKRVERIFEHASPGLSKLALSLSPQQIVNIERRFVKNNEKYRKGDLRGALDERQNARFRKVMKQAEYWFGDFTPAQQERIRAASNARPLDYELWTREHLRRQSELIALLKKIQAEKPSREATAALLRTYMKTALENFTYAQHQPFFDASREGMAQMTAQIVNLATPAQKAHATRRLQKLIEDGHALAGKGSAPPLSLQMLD